MLLFRLNAQNLFVGTENGIVRVYARQTEGYIIRDVYCCDPSGVIYYHLPLERDIIVYEPHPGGQVYELHTKKWRTMLRGQKPVQ